MDVNDPVRMLAPQRLLRKISNRLVAIYKRHVLRDRFSIEVKRWFRDRGDDTLRLEYPELNAHSVVFDVGGYQGDFAEAIHQKYGCRVYVFEPHPRYFEQCVRRFQDEDSVVILNYGLSDTDGSFGLTDSVDGSSFLDERKSGHAELECMLRSFSSVLDELHVRNIDLMKINIEGGEYPLLQSMADQSMLSVVDDFQIQFHDFAVDAVKRRHAILESLSKSHECTWCYEFVWENWKRLSST